MSLPFSYKVTNPSRLDVFLQGQTELSRTLIQEQIENGAVFVNKQPITKSSYKLKIGDEVSGQFTIVEEDVSFEPIDHPLDVLYEDESLLFINKEQGTVVHPAKGHRGETLVHYLLHYLRNNPDFHFDRSDRPGIVHRLDRGTSGVIVIAKNRNTLEKLQRLFKERLVKKTYQAVVWGKTSKEDQISLPIGRHPIDRKKMSSKSQEPKEAITLYTQMQAFNHFSHLFVYPRTGRTHQIRVHLTERGFPIVGDALYGPKNTLGNRRTLSSKVQEFLLPITETFLHASSLELIHPHSKAPLSIQAPLPSVFDNFLKLLKEEDLGTTR